MEKEELLRNFLEGSDPIISFEKDLDLNRDVHDATLTHASHALRNALMNQRLKIAELIRNNISRHVAHSKSAKLCDSNVNFGALFASLEDKISFNRSLVAEMDQNIAMELRSLKLLSEKLQKTSELNSMDDATNDIFSRALTKSLTLFKSV